MHSLTLYQTLNSFVLEAELPPDIGAASDDLVTIESVLQEKKRFDLSLNFEKLGIDDTNQGWAVRAPTEPKEVASLPNRSNILSISVLNLLLPLATASRQYIAVSTADRHLHLMDPCTPDFELAQTYSSFQDSPALDIVPVDTQHILIASMSGKLTLFNTASNRVIEERKDHNKYLVKLSTFLSDGGSMLVASAGWDAKVYLYKLDLSAEKPRLGDRIATLTLPSIPESTMFVTLPGDGTPALVIARRDSTFLYYYAVPDASSPVFTLLGKQNLAPHSNAWVAFTPSDIQICPTDPFLAAVATSRWVHAHDKHLRIVLMLYP